MIEYVDEFYKSKRYYTGVGSRNAPMYILYMMSKLAMIFEKKGFILRSGCATGADAAFESGVLNPKEMAEIYIPNKSFPDRMHDSYKSYYIVPKETYGLDFNGLYYSATRLIHSKNIHKYWFRGSLHVMDLHNRNMFQVLGRDLSTKSVFNVCYTRGRELKYSETTKDTGGTATSINACDLYNIELFNLSVDEHYIRLLDFIKLNDSLIDYDRLDKIIPRTKLNKILKNKCVHDYGYFKDIINKEMLERESKFN